VELEEREEKICRKCGKFGHLAWHCRSGEESKKSMMRGNRFKVLGSRVMQCGMKDLRRQEVVKETPRCFTCGEEGHKKWECPKGKKERREEEVALLYKVWEKIRKHCRAKGSPLQGAVMSMEGWTMKWEVVALVECRGCDYKGQKHRRTKGKSS